MTQPNPIVNALTSIVAGAAGGAVVATAGVMLAWSLLNAGITAIGEPGNLVYLSGALGLAVAAFLGWRLSAGLTEAWRRGVVATLAAFGAVGLGSAAMPLEMFFSRVYTLVYTLALAGIWFFAARVAGRHGTTGTPPTA
ncbi:MAG: hypothetical protein HY560_14395 [Gemmatimonadetes bacterium]|nr:hypothetical protein [Gemmatimonadota bacterium]